MIASVVSFRERTLQSEVRMGLENSSWICLGKVGFWAAFSSELLQKSELRWAGRKQCLASFWGKKVKIKYMDHIHTY